MAYRLSERSYALNCFVNQKIERLQREYLGSGSQAASARARLARLRRLISDESPSLLEIGDDVLPGWPIERLGEPFGDSRELRAVCVAIGAYAFMQQGKSYGVAVFSENEEERKINSFGRACRQIQPDKDMAKGVMRRLSSVEAAVDYPGVVNGVRALLSLMRAAHDGGDSISRIRLDFGLLAADLYGLQGMEWQKDAVISRWGSAYFVPMARKADRSDTNS